MTGPEHYARAQELITEAQGKVPGHSLRLALVAEAQAHATLAHVAATIDAGAASRRTYENRDGDTVSHPDVPNVGAWWEVMS